MTSAVPGHRPAGSARAQLVRSLAMISPAGPVRSGPRRPPVDSLAVRGRPGPVCAGPQQVPLPGAAGRLIRTAGSAAGWSRGVRPGRTGYPVPAGFASGADRARGRSLRGWHQVGVGVHPGDRQVGTRHMRPMGLTGHIVPSRVAAGLRLGTARCDSVPVTTGSLPHRAGTGALTRRVRGDWRDSSQTLEQARHGAGPARRRAAAIQGRP
jgi:hypothetical protein